MWRCPLRPTASRYRGDVQAMLDPQLGAQQDAFVVDGIAGLEESRGESSGGGDKAVVDLDPDAVKVFVFPVALNQEVEIGIKCEHAA